MPLILKHHHGRDNFVDMPLPWPSYSMTATKTKYLKMKMSIFYVKVCQIGIPNAFSSCETVTLKHLTNFN